MTEFIISQEPLKNLIKKYFSEATETQVETLTEEMLREITVMIHAKIRALVRAKKDQRV